MNVLLRQVVDLHTEKRPSRNMGDTVKVNVAKFL